VPIVCQALKKLSFTDTRLGVYDFLGAVLNNE
jgi:hypothetical protein